MYVLYEYATDVWIHMLSKNGEINKNKYVCLL